MFHTGELSHKPGKMPAFSFCQNPSDHTSHPTNAARNNVWSSTLSCLSLMHDVYSLPFIFPSVCTGLLGARWQRMSRVRGAVHCLVVLKWIIHYLLGNVDNPCQAMTFLWKFDCQVWSLLNWCCLLECMRGLRDMGRFWAADTSQISIMRLLDIQNPGPSEVDAFYLTNIQPHA